MSWMDVLGTVVMLGGCFFVVVAAVGMVRLPDVYCRSHALGKAMTLGIMLLLVGYGLRVPEASWLKIALILLFQLVTIPVASHLFCLVAYRKGVRRWANRAPAGAGSEARTG
ncbi:monovalent cation/H(+) antiporter subunit G [Sorangium sp. So ce315]|uniref:monovalent cation/H(+) antiporter subunit G n=1 Tax=Sorangium sp. So ce315 TaxID=3133299 RepID=UPI003F5ECDDD